MNDVLLLLHDDKGQDARLEVALDLATSLSGRLSCLDVVVPSAASPAYGPGPGNVISLAELREREDANVAHIRDRLETEDVDWKIRRVSGDPADRLREASVLADVIVVSSSSDASDSVDARRVAAELLLKSDRLVLAVPPNCRELDLSRRALVAWNGSSGAMRALRETLPLLRRASDVILFEFGSGNVEFATDDAVAYLEDHRVQSVSVVIPADGAVSGMLDYAELSSASFLVMGAFERGRLIERLLGGVTSEVLARSSIPMFLHH